MIKCNSCGAENNDTSRFCMECGGALEAAPAVEEETIPAAEEAPVVEEETAPAAEETPVVEEETAPAAEETPAAEEEEAAPEAEITTPTDGVEQEIGGFKFRPVPDKEIDELVHKKTSPAVKLAALAAAVAVIAGFTVMVCSVRGNQKTDKIRVIDDNGKYVFVCNGEKLEGSVRDASYYDRAGDGSAVAVLDEDDTLYAVSKKGVEKVAKDVEEFIVSSEGGYIIYTDDDEDSFLYNIKKDKSVKMDREVDVYSAVFSPDEKYILFNDNDKGNLYLYHGKESEKIDEDVTPVAVSDGGKRIYAEGSSEEPKSPEKPDSDDYEEYDDYSKAYEEYEEAYEEYEEALDIYYAGYGNILYYYPNGNKDKRAELGENLVSSYYFNSDISQVMFMDSEEETYYCEKDDKPVKIAEYDINRLDSEITGYYANSIVYSIVYKDKDILDTLFSGDGAVSYINKKGEMDELDDEFESYYSVKFSSNDKKICFRNDEYELYIMNTKNGDKERVAKDVFLFAAEDDLKSFYVLKSDNKLYYVKANGDSERIDKSVDSISKAPSGGVYYISDGDLYYADKTKTEKIDIGSKYEAESIFADEHYAYVEVYNDKKDEYAVFVSKKGNEKFEKISDGFIASVSY